MSRFLYKPTSGPLGRLEASVDMKRCRVSVPNGGRDIRSHQCHRNATVERDGIGYCGPHDPERPKKPKPMTMFERDCLRGKVDGAALEVARLLARDKDMLSLPDSLSRALAKFESIEREARQAYARDKALRSKS